MLKLAAAAAMMLVTALPALAQVRHESITTTTIQGPPIAPAEAPPPEPLPPDANAGPAQPPGNLGVLEDKIVHPGTVTTSGESTTVTVPGQTVGTSSHESTRVGVDLP